MEGEGEVVDPRNVEKIIMESRQCGRKRWLVEEKKQVPAGKRAKKYNKVTSCYLWDDTVPIETDMPI